MSSKGLSYIYLARINDLFRSKGWEIDSGNKSSLFNRYISTCSLLNTDEVELFLKISKEYKIVTLGEYQQQLLNLLKSAVETYPPQKKSQILIYPIKTAEDREYIKSSDVVSYLCRSVNMKYDDTLSSRNAIIINNLEDLKNHISKIVNGNPIYIVDDFIGSGEYVSSVICELIDAGIPKESVVVCSLYLFEMGKSLLEEAGINYVCNNLVESIIPQLTEAETELLVSISKKLKVKEEHRLGYNNSGALITLIRTPNNTIPIFCENIKSSKNAPFPRNK